VVDRLVPVPVPVLPDDRTAAVADELWVRFRRLLADSGHELVGAPGFTADHSPEEKELR
jgi:hypothetical protein